MTGTITTTIIDPQGNAQTVVIGPSGVGWTPVNQPTGAPELPPPSNPPPASGNSLGSSQAGASNVPPPAQSSASGDLTGSSRAGALSVPQSAQSSPSGKPPGSSQAGASIQVGQTVVTGTVGSQTVTETFVLTTMSVLTSLSSTVTTTTSDAESSLETLLVGPGGVARTPLSQLPSGVPQLPPPAVHLSSVNQPGSSPKVTRAPITGQPSAATTSTAAPSSASGAFDNPNQSETTIIVGGTTLHYSKETIQSLSTITAPTTITTPRYVQDLCDMTS